MRDKQLELIDGIVNLIMKSLIHLNKEETEHLKNKLIMIADFLENHKEETLYKIFDIDMEEEEEDCIY